MSILNNILNIIKKPGNRSFQFFNFIFCMKKAFVIIPLVSFLFACTDNAGNERSAKAPPVTEAMLSEGWRAIAAIKDSIHDGDLVTVGVKNDTLVFTGTKTEKNATP